MKFINYLFVMVVLSTSCLSFNDSVLVKNLKTDPNNSKYVYDLYMHYEKNAMFSDQLLTMWRYLIIADDIQKSKHLIEVFYNRLYTIPPGMKKETIYLSNENMAEGRGFNLSMELTFGFEKNKILDDKNKNKSFMEKNVEFFTDYLTLLTEIFKKRNINDYKDNFAVEYFLPYYVELVEKNFIEPFAYKIFSSYDTDEIRTWLIKNDDKMKDFLEWSKNYSWVKNKTE